ncbi:MAG: hypothetical protein IKE58_12565 [Blautia sp.]|nr:hypothetical protein [Blautia sp.]
MDHHPKLIVMLTHHDRTVADAPEIFETCQNTKAEFWGFKEDGLSFPKMKKLFSDMKNCGKKTGLEVVAYTEKECLDGAKVALECGCDMLMGTLFFDSVNEFCLNHKLKYFPFIGEVTERPSVLNGLPQDMIEEGKRYIKKGASGIDLLGYRYTGDAFSLNKLVTQSMDAPVCIAGSVNSWQRLDEIKEIRPWTFTIGGAFFENRFGTVFAEQVDRVCDYIRS